ncbi:MAG: S9 family peptidase [Candidatus Aminicenantes bacterium]|nr:S9 family peptidase [Candidatus Aminicenantes bacterium]
MNIKKKLCFSILILVFLSGLTLWSQEPYKKPPQEVIDMVEAPPPPQASLSPDGKTVLLTTYEIMPSLEYMAQPLLRLAGTRITPLNNSRQQTYFLTSVSLKTLKDGKTIPVDFPEDAKFGFPRWSNDSAWFAITRYLNNGVELWAVETKTGKAKKLLGPTVNAVLSSGFTWLPDNRHILATVVPDDRGNPPEKPTVPIGPHVQEVSGKFAKVWTYQDLLETPYDEKLFTYYATSQMVKIDVPTGKTEKFGDPGILTPPDASPNGKLLMVYRIKKPFSYSVPYYYFTHNIEIWDMDGNLVHMLAEVPLADDVPMRGVPTGVRSVEWRALKPATIIWVEALDEGDPEKTVPHRDKVMTLSYPFKGEAKEMTKTVHRYSGMDWLQNPDQAFLTEFDWKRRWRTTYFINPDDPSQEPKKVIDLSIHDRYNDPGRPVHTITPNGQYVILQDKDFIYLSGSGANPQGARPFLDKVNVNTMEKERIFESGEESYESFVDFIGESRTLVMTSYQSKTEPPNYFLVDLKSGDRQAMTDYKDPAPQMTGMIKKLVKYKRDDGVDLSGTLYLPPDYKEGQRLPLVFWAYPLEYSDPSLAGQVRSSPNRFTFFRSTSQLFFVTQGYAVLDGAQLPIIGDPKTMNDTFIEQIVAGAKAAIDYLDKEGIIDPNRVGVGGHSYGAFMTANFLAHCDLFAAGIARSGAYNRTLTPFGFQSERRTLWEAPEIYFKISPFMHAHKINEPILLIHGEEDNNSGTFPIQSRRLFHALKGHGATVRMVMLPHESHGYRAKESVLHVLAEMFDWFDKYVKNKEK